MSPGGYCLGGRGSIKSRKNLFVRGKHEERLKGKELRFMMAAAKRAAIHWVQSSQH